MRILCVHQGYELYGSDRCFANSVRSIRAEFPDARIDVLLPQPGPLAQLVTPMADELRFGRLWVVRKRRLGRLLMHGAATLPVALALAIASFRKSDLVYINTITVINYLLVARLFRSKTLLHVHEAPVGVLGKMYAALVRRICVPTIYNSEATRRAYEITERALTFVLYNGIRGPTTSTACSYNGARRLRLLMIGRLSRQKGQDILIEACGLLSPTALRSIEIAIVGSSFEFAN